MAATSVGQIGLDLVVNQNQFQKQMSGVTSLAKKAGAALAAAFAVKKIVQFGKECTELGSNLAEVQNVVDVTFPSMTAQVDKFAKSAAASFGLSETMAKKYTGTFGAMAKAFGFTESAAFDMGSTLTGLAGDVASFYNISQDEAYTKLKSVFTGETETLKDLGVVMTQNALDAYAMANGIGKTTQQMTEAEKVALRYKFVQEQLTAATGDFARTSGSWANQVRLMKLQFDSLKATIGQGLINLLTPVIRVINTLLGKLTTLANAFKSFTELITGNKSSGSSTMANPVSDLVDTAGDASTGLSDASGAADNLADNTSGVGKAAKKAAKEMKALMGFDQVNKLSDPVDDSDSGDDGGSPSGSGIDSGGLGGAVDYGKLAEGETALDKLSNKIQPLIDRAKELAALFKKGFEIGFGDSEKKIDSIKNHLTGIGKSLRKIFTDGEVVAAANGLFDSIALNAGKIAGSMASIGLTVADNLVGGIDKYLQKSKGYIKDRLISIFDVSADIANLAGNFSTAFANIFDGLRSDAGKNCTAAVIGIFSDGFLGALDLALKFGRDVIKVITQPIVDNQDKIKTALENTLAPLSTFMTTIHDGVVNTFKKIHSVYDEHIAPLFQSLADGLSDIVSHLMDAYNDYIAPVLQTLADKFNEVWTNSIQPAIDAALDLIGKVADLIKALWENILVPLATWIIDNVVPILAPIFQSFGEIVLNVFGGIWDAVKNIINVFGGLVDFLIGVFTGNWSLAWEGIKSIFSNIWELIKGVVSTVWEAIKGVIETAFNAVKGVVTTYLDNIKSKFSAIWNAIKDTVSKAINAVKSTITSILAKVISDVKFKLKNIKDVFVSVFNSIKDTVSNIFNGIWNIIRGVVNSILGGIETMVNGVIDGVNSIANAFNSMNIDIPDWVPGIGGGTIGFNLPTFGGISLPRLAQGGYVKPNTPQLAMIGDNRHQGEVVAPENKLLEMARMAAEMSGAGNAEVSVLLKEILEFLKRINPVDIDEEALRKYFITKTNHNTKSNGKCELLT